MKLSELKKLLITYDKLKPWYWKIKDEKEIKILRQYISNGASSAQSDPDLRLEAFKDFAAQGEIIIDDKYVFSDSVASNVIFRPWSFSEKQQSSISLASSSESIARASSSSMVAEARETKHVDLYVESIRPEENQRQIINKLTFASREPVENIDPNNLLVLDGYAFDVDELFNYVSTRPEHIYTNPHWLGKKIFGIPQSPEFTDPTKEIIRKHKRFSRFAENFDEIQKEPKKFIKPATVDEVIKLLQNIIASNPDNNPNDMKIDSGGENDDDVNRGVDAAREKFLEYRKKLDGIEKRALDYYFIKVPSAFGGIDGNTQNMFFKDAFWGGLGRCIKTTQIFLWKFVTDFRSDITIPQQIQTLAQQQQAVIRAPVHAHVGTSDSIMFSDGHEDDEFGIGLPHRHSPAGIPERVMFSDDFADDELEINWTHALMMPMIPGSILGSGFNFGATNLLGSIFGGGLNFDSANLPAHFSSKEDTQNPTSQDNEAQLAEFKGSQDETDDLTSAVHDSMDPTNEVTVIRASFPGFFMSYSYSSPRPFSASAVYSTHSEQKKPQETSSVKEGDRLNKSHQLLLHKLNEHPLFMDVIFSPFATSVHHKLYTLALFKLCLLENCEPAVELAKILCSILGIPISPSFLIDGMTAIHCAAQNNPAMYQFLTTKYGEQIALIKDKHGRTAFDYKNRNQDSGTQEKLDKPQQFQASFYNQKGIHHNQLVIELLNDPNIVQDRFSLFVREINNQLYSKALQILCTLTAQDAFEIAKILLRFKDVLPLEPNVCNYEGMAAIHYAARNNPKIYDLLCQTFEGIAMTHDNQGKSAVQYAYEAARREKDIGITLSFR